MSSLDKLSKPHKEGMTYIEVLVSIVLIGVVLLPLASIGGDMYRAQQRASGTYRMSYHIQNILYDLEEKLEVSDYEYYKQGDQGTIYTLNDIFEGRIADWEARYEVAEYTYELAIHPLIEGGRQEAVYFSNKDISESEDLYLSELLHHDEARQLRAGDRISHEAISEEVGTSFVIVIGASFGQAYYGIDRNNVEILSVIHLLEGQ